MSSDCTFQSDIRFQIWNMLHLEIFHSFFLIHFQFKSIFCSFFSFLSFCCCSYLWCMQSNIIKPYIDTNYTISDDKMQRHRALAIIKPLKNMTGEYTCQVGSFTNDDKRVKYLQMIVPETDLKLTVTKDNDEDDALTIMCIVKDIYPAPKLTISYVWNIFSRMFVLFLWL